MQKIFDSFTSKYQLGSKCKFTFIQNNLPVDLEIKEPFHIDFNYSCMSAARRAVLYGCLINNLLKLELDQVYDLEREVQQKHIIEPTEPGVLDLKETLFVQNLQSYRHFLIKMWNFLLSSQLIWPLSTQRHRTQSRPICTVRLAEHFYFNSDTTLYLEHLKRDHKYYVEHHSPTTAVVELNGSNSYITLCNLLTQTKTNYFFQWDGEPVFAPSQPSHESSCTISSLLGTLSALHERLKNLELAN